jgi:inosine-uridine nucleoside N-ribohydrolase
VRLLLILLATVAFAAQPTLVIFDTDIGNDVDDALALAMLHSLESRRETQILAVTITKDNRYAAPYIDLVNTFYGRPDIPIGVVRNGKTPEDSPMIRMPADLRKPDGSFVYPHRITDGASATDAITVLRRVLSTAPDGSVVVVQVGFSTNLARLIANPDDLALVSRKVRLLSVMAGHFPEGAPEYNVKTDIASARHVFDQWPTPIVLSGFEIGQALLFPAQAVEQGFRWASNHPVADAYRAYMKMPYNRPTWDLTAALYAVRPDAGYFNLSPPGRVTVDDAGRTHFDESPGGKHRYLILTEAQKARTLEALILLATEPRP